MLKFFLTCDMTEHVVPGDVLLREAPVADVAPERPHSAVHEAVALEVARRREGLAAHLALVGLLLDREKEKFEKVMLNKKAQ